jgi:hypothetical protein
MQNIAVYSDCELYKIKQFFIYKDFYKKTMPQNECIEIENNTYKWTEQKYITVENKERTLIFSVIRYRLINDCLFEFHPYVLQELWGTPLSYVMDDMMVEWIKEHTLCNKLITFIPENLTIVCKAAQSHGLVKEGSIEHGAYWDHKLTNLLIYTKII